PNCQPWSIRTVEERDLDAVPVRHRADDRKAEAATLDLRVGRAHETLEDTLSQRLRNPGSLVRYGQARAPLLRREAGMHARAARCILHGVVDEVHEKHAQILGDADDLGVTVDGGPDDDRLGDGYRLDLVDRSSEAVGKADGLGDACAGMGIIARQA